MKKKYAYLILALLALLLLTAQQCGTSEQQSPTEEEAEPVLLEEEEFEESEQKDTISSANYYPKFKAVPNAVNFTRQTTDDPDIGEADFSLVAAWEKFEVKNYQVAAELLGLANDYLWIEGEDLKGRDKTHLEATILKINDLFAALEKEGKKEDQLLSATFSSIGLNLVKIYLAIAVEMNGLPNDNEYFLAKTSPLLEKIIPTLRGEEKIAVNELADELINYRQEAYKSTRIEGDNIKELNEQLFLILEKQKINF